MKFKYLFFALLTAASASSFTGCNESTPDPKPQEPCATCENETIVDSLFEYEMVVKKHQYDREGDYITYILVKLDNEGNYETTPYNPLVPCPALSNEYKVEDLKVYVTGHVKSCDKVLTEPDLRISYGNKLDLISITKK